MKEQRSSVFLNKERVTLELIFKTDSTVYIATGSYALEAWVEVVKGMDNKDNGKYL